MSVHQVRTGVAGGALVALLALSPVAGGARGATAEDAGSVAITSDPAGASVFVDGRFEGSTPLRVDGVTPGGHRVAVSKPGYREERQVVEVDAGETLDVAVPLTPQPPVRARVQEGEEAATSGGGGGKTLAFTALGVAAGAAGGYLLGRDTNDVPPAPTVSCSPDTGLASATSIRCSAEATDPDGDQLTYTWDFGDGASGSGQSASHIYANAGSYSVRGSVTDGEGSPSGTASVTIRDLTGTWSGPINFNGFPVFTTVTLTQSGSALSGSFTDEFDERGTVPSGSVSPPNQVIFTVRFDQFLAISFIGEVDQTFSRMTGRVEGGSLTGLAWTLSR